MTALDESDERSFNSAHGPGRSITDLLLVIGRWLPDWLAGLMRVAQAGGELDPALSPDTLTHFCLLLAMGSALVTPDPHAVDDEEWASLLTRIVTALAPAGIPAQTGTAR